MNRGILNLSTAAGKSCCEQRCSCVETAAAAAGVRFSPFLFWPVQCVADHANKFATRLTPLIIATLRELSRAAQGIFVPLLASYDSLAAPARFFLAAPRGWTSILMALHLVLCYKISWKSFFLYIHWVSSWSERNLVLSISNICVWYYQNLIISFKDIRNKKFVLKIVLALIKTYSWI